MTQDLKDLAHAMGVEFAAAVKKAEAEEATEIDSIIKSMDQSYQIFVTKQAECQKRRTQLLEELVKCGDMDDEATALYQNEVADLANRLEHFKRQKIGTPVQNDSVAQRGNRRFGVVG